MVGSVFGLGFRVWGSRGSEGRDIVTIKLIT